MSQQTVEQIALSDLPVIECEPTHCYNCPFFEGYSDRGRGICKLFDRVEFDHHTITQDCRNKIKSEKAEAETQTSAPSPLSRPVKKPHTKAFPWVSMLGMVASTAIFTSTTPRAIASPETQTPPPHKDQSPHRGTGRREFFTDIDADAAYVMAMEAKHEADFYAQHESIVEVETVLRNGKAVCGVWCGTRMIGTYYRDIKTGRWVADSTVKQIRSQFDASEQAKDAIVKAWKSSRN